MKYLLSIIALLVFSSAMSQELKYEGKIKDYINPKVELYEPNKNVKVPSTEYRVIPVIVNVQSKPIVEKVYYTPIPVVRERIVFPIVQSIYADQYFIDQIVSDIYKDIPVWSNKK